MDSWGQRNHVWGPVPEEIFTHSRPSWSSDILIHKHKLAIVVASSRYFQEFAYVSFSFASSRYSQSYSIGCKSNMACGYQYLAHCSSCCVSGIDWPAAEKQAASDWDTRCSRDHVGSGQLSEGNFAPYLLRCSHLGDRTRISVRCLNVQAKLISE